MLGLNERLKDLANHKRNINVGIVGLGQMGLSLASHLNDIKGFKVCAAADRNLEKVNQLGEVLSLDLEKIYTFIDKSKLNKNDESNNIFHKIN